jgi:hypothetical protein
MWRSSVLVALVVALLAVSVGARAADEHFARLVDTPTAHTYLKGDFSLGLEVVGDGGLRGSAQVGASDFFYLGISYGGENVIGSGNPDWYDSIEVDAKFRLAPEGDPIPALAIGYDGRGYGAQLEDGTFEKPSLGFYAVLTKTLPFSEFWQLHGGIGRTLELERARPDFWISLSARFSEEFSVLTEYQLGNDATKEDPTDKTGYLNLGLRWVFMEQIVIDFYFRNLLGPSGSPNLSSRAIAFTFYQSF